MEIRAAIDDNCLPRDKRGFIGSKEHHGAHDIGWMLVTAKDSRLQRDLLEFFDLHRIGAHPIG
jgi:hypothetical protein